MKLICVFFLLIISSGFTKAQTFESGNKKVSLIELYTSEGCSSCPPADRWLSSLRDDENLWSGFVPMAFHVDYWDYIGWKDPYASKEYSQRQRRYANEYGESTVYTPGVRKNGEEWRLWRFFGDLESKQKIDPGNISITVDEKGAFAAHYVESEDVNPESLQLNIAVLGLGLSNDVTRGENRGKILAHDFVVLGVSRYASFEKNRWKGQIPEPSVDASRYAIAAWVSEGQFLKPVQATGGFLAKQ